MTTHLLATDLNHILNKTAPLWEELRNQRFFVTGGTGFFGVWLLESFLWANQLLKLNANAVVLTRDTGSFAIRHPILANTDAITFHEGDIRNFTFPAGHFSHIIHAAADMHNTTMDTIVQGTTRVIEFARQCKAKKLLLTSSGAIYDHQRDNMTPIDEDAPLLDLEQTASEYALAKYQAENLAYATQCDFEIKIVRCFAFIGPYLPLDKQYAIGNFIRDGLNGGPIILNSTGTDYRSYLYSADLAIWLWTILFRGTNKRAYNVGSDMAYTIKELANLVAQAFNTRCIEKITAAPKNIAKKYYVPNVARANKELNLVNWHPLDKAITTTIRWHLLTKDTAHENQRQ